MKLSVIITTYNRSHLLVRAIKSVLHQTIKPFEIIVVDDGSTDETKKVVQNFPVSYIYQRNSGISSARNLGIKVSKGDVIAFLDDDDEWLSNKIELQLPFHDKGYRFTHTEEFWIKNSKYIKQKKHHKKPDGECFYENISFCKIAPSTVMIDRDLVDEVGYFDESLKVCEDFDMWLRVLKVTPIKLVQKKLTKKYAGESSQLSFENFHMMDIYRVQALMKHLNDSIIEEEIEKKLTILKNGAVKYKNSELLMQVENVRGQIKKFTRFSGNISIL